MVQQAPGGGGGLGAPLLGPSGGGGEAAAAPAPRTRGVATAARTQYFQVTLVAMLAARGAARPEVRWRCFCGCSALFWVMVGCRLATGLALATLLSMWCGLIGAMDATQRSFFYAVQRVQVLAPAVEERRGP